MINQILVESRVQNYKVAVRTHASAVLFAIFQKNY